jgi:hypothetical protein
MLLALSYTAVMPVFYFTQPSLGGYGLTPLYMSFFMGLAGLSQALWLLFAFPPLQTRFGTGAVLRGCSVVWPFFFLAHPVCNEILRKGWKVPFWVVAPMVLAVGSGVAMAFSMSLRTPLSPILSDISISLSPNPLVYSQSISAAIQLALNDISPSPQTLGTLNALALTLISGLRAVVPALFTSIFATGVRNHILDGHLVWIILVLLALGYTVGVRWLPEKAEGKVKTGGGNE